MAQMNYLRGMSHNEWQQRQAQDSQSMALADEDTNRRIMSTSEIQAEMRKQEKEEQQKGGAAEDSAKIQSGGQNQPLTSVTVLDNNEAIVKTISSSTDASGNAVQETTSTTIRVNQDGSVDQITNSTTTVFSESGKIEAASSLSQHHANAADFAVANGVDVKTNPASEAADLSDISAASLAGVLVVADVAGGMGLPKPVITSGRDGSHRANSHHYTSPSMALDFRGYNISDDQLRKFAGLVQVGLGSQYRAIPEFYANPARDHLHVEYKP